MPKFTEIDDTTETTLLALEVGGTKRLHFHEERKATSVTVSSSDSTVAKEAGAPILFNGPRGSWTIDVRGVGEGQAFITARGREGVMTALAVTVAKAQPPVKLPPDGLDSGLLARLLLTEVLAPEKSGYNPTTAKKAMQYMVLVVRNRLKTPGRFGAKGATKISQIVQAKGQFGKFSDYPHLPTGVMEIINGTIRRANDNRDSMQIKYRDHAQMAISVASAPPIADPSPNGLIGWRKAQSGSPGGDFIDFGAPMLENQFYQWKVKH